MRQLSHILALSLSLLVAVHFISGCKETTIINSKLSPSNSAIGVFDTILPCVTANYYNDTAITSVNIGGIPIYQAVGTFLDPYFGTMTGATYFNIIPDDFTLLQDSLIDSAVLVLPYTGFTYGDTATSTLTQTYQVFYMLDTIDIATTYYSTSSKPVDYAHPLSAPTTINIHQLRDSLLSVLPQDISSARIPLNLPNLKRVLLPAVGLLATSTNPIPDFLNAFNGICVMPADTRQMGAAIPYFQLDGLPPYSAATIMVYYHDAGTNDTEIASYSFSTSDCGHFNAITKSYGRYPVNNVLHTSQQNSNVVVLQNAPGPYIDVKIPGMTHLPAGIINKAELQLPLLPGSGNAIFPNGDSISLAPERIYPNGVGNGIYPSGITAGLTYILADRYPIYSSSPLAIIDGYVHSYTEGGVTVNALTLDIPREVMASIAAGNDTLHLQIGGTLDYYGAFHMVAGGGSYPDSLYRAKFFVVYSKLKN